MCIVDFISKFQELCTFISIIFFYVLKFAFQCLCYLVNWSSIILLVILLLKFRKNQQLTQKINHNKEKKTLKGSGEIPPSNSAPKRKNSGRQAKLNGKSSLNKSSGAQLEQKGLPKEVAIELGLVLECIISNYVDPWWTALTNSREFPEEMRRMMVECCGILSNQFTKRIKLMPFVLEKVTEALRLHLQWYTEYEKKAALSNAAAFALCPTYSTKSTNLTGREESRVKLESEELLEHLRKHMATPAQILQRNQLVVDEMRKANRLHSALLNKIGRMQDLYDSERRAESQMVYIKHLSKQVSSNLFSQTKHLPADLRPCRMTQLFVEEMIACFAFRSPVVRIFVPDRINRWILRALDYNRKKALLVARQQANIDCPSAPMCVVNKQESPHWFPPGMPPPGSGISDHDKSWEFFAGEKTREEVDSLLTKDKPPGTFLIYHVKHETSLEIFTLAVLGDFQKKNEQFPLHFSLSSGECIGSTTSAWTEHGRKRDKPWHIRLHCLPNSFQCLDQEILADCTPWPTLLDLLSQFDGPFKIDTEKRGIRFLFSMERMSQETSEISCFESAPTLPLPRCSSSPETSFGDAIVDCTADELHPKTPINEKSSFCPIICDQEVEMSDEETFTPRKRGNTTALALQDSKNETKKRLSKHSSEPDLSHLFSTPDMQTLQRTPFTSKTPTLKNELRYRPEPTVFEIVYELFRFKIEMGIGENWQEWQPTLPSGSTKQIEAAEADLEILIQDQQRKVLLYELEGAISQIQDVKNYSSDEVECWSTPEGIAALSRCINQIHEILSHGVRSSPDREVAQRILKRKKHVLDQNASNQTKPAGAFSMPPAELDDLIIVEKHGNNTRPKVHSDSNLSETKASAENNMPFKQGQNSKGSLGKLDSEPFAVRCHSQTSLSIESEQDTNARMIHYTVNVFSIEAHGVDRCAWQKDELEALSRGYSAGPGLECFKRKVEDLMGFAWICAEMQTGTLYSSLVKLVQHKERALLLESYKSTSILNTVKDCETFLKMINTLCQGKYNTQAALLSQLHSKGYVASNAKAPVSKGVSPVPHRSVAIHDLTKKKRPKKHLQFKGNCDLAATVARRISRAEAYAERMYHAEDKIKRAHRMEEAFKLKLKLQYLLANRPHPGYLRSRNLYLAPRSRIKASVTRTEMAQLISEEEGRKEVALYYIKVRYIVCSSMGHYLDTSEVHHCNNCKSKEWEVCRRFSDFNALREHLKSEISKSAKLRFLPSLPDKRGLIKFDLGGFLEKRRQELDEHLHTILQSPVLNQCAELYIFLGYHPDYDEWKNDTDLRSQSRSTSNGDLAKVPVMTSEPILQSHLSTGSIPLEKETETTQIPFLGSLEMHQVELSLHELVKEIFDVDGLHFMRRTFVDMATVIIQLIFSNSIVDFFSNQYQKYGSSRCAAQIISYLRETMWPGGKKQPASTIPLPDSTEVQQELQIRLRASIPGALQSLFGKQECERAALKLFNFIQDDVLVKNLMWTVIDLFIVELFPDMAGDVDGIDLLYR